MIRAVKVNSDYVDALRNIDDKVYDNKSGKRTYIGFLIDIDDALFVAPLTSPKPKHLKWTNKKKDVHLIDNGQKGVLQLSNMIPVQKELCEEIDLSVPSKYNTLLKNQVISIDNDKYKVESKARNLIKLNETKPNHYLLKNCCDYKRLKQVCENWDK